MSDWSISKDGNVTFAVAAEYRVAIFYESVIGLRLEFFPSAEQARLGAREAVQVSMHPSFARELGRALLERADIAEAPPDTKPS